MVQVPKRRSMGGGWVPIAVVVIIVVAGALGASTRRHDPLVAAATAGSFVLPRPSSAPRTAPPSATFATPTGRPTATATAPVIDLPAGYWLSDPDGWVRVGNAYGRSCSYDFCAEAVTLSIALAGSPIVIALGGREVAIGGTTLAKVRKAWRTAVPHGTDADSTVDGQPAFVGSSPSGQRVIFAVHGGRMYAFAGGSLGGDPDRILAQFLLGFHFIVSPCWLQPCPEGDASDDPTDALATFDVARARGTWHADTNDVGSSVDDASTRTWSVKCSDTCLGSLRIAVGTTATGPLVAPGTSQRGYQLTLGQPTIRIRGATLDALEQDWEAQVGTGTFERITLDGVPATRIVRGGVQNVFAIRRGYVIAISSVGMLAFDNYPNGPYAAFALGFSFVAGAARGT
jgi:hypothetical protein